MKWWYWWEYQSKTCHSATLSKSHTDWSGIEPGPQWWQAGDSVLGSCHGLTGPAGLSVQHWTHSDNSQFIPQAYLCTDYYAHTFRPSPLPKKNFGNAKLWFAVTIKLWVFSTYHYSHATTSETDSTACLYVVQHSVETTYYSVNGHCSCSPTNAGFARDLGLP